MNGARSLTVDASFTLKNSSIYARLKNSWVWDLYWRVKDPRLVEVKRKQVEFYRDLLKGFRPGDIIFDVGANVGVKTAAFLRLGATVVAVEPDEQNQKVLRAKFIRYRLSSEPVFIVGKAASEDARVETMWVDGPGSALNTLSQKWVNTLKADKGRFAHTLDVLEFAEKKSVETTTLERLSAEYGLPFFVKIDVEGYELRVLKGLQHPVPYLSFEINLPEFRQEGIECLTLLRNLAPKGEFNYASDVTSGLALQRWASFQEIEHIVESCTETSIEVFWRTLPLPRSD
jgi:FkbM family methyltransferase